MTFYRWTKKALGAYTLISQSCLPEKKLATVLEREVKWKPQTHTYVKTQFRIKSCVMMIKLCKKIAMLGW